MREPKFEIGETVRMKLPPEFLGGMQALGRVVEREIIDYPGSREIHYRIRTFCPRTDGRMDLSAQLILVHEDELEEKQP